ncbi:glycosyltransferase family 4 protein [Cyclobacterium plantarum]|uniref:glycosyltransferase family 4 protein n=1 Tax=Cyclobacterium plantarum TaxID=2716263 RepID=UPI003F6E7726
MSLHVLHLANDYSGSKIYSELCQSFDKLKVKQSIYTAIRRESDFGKNKLIFSEDSKIIYSFILNLYTRFNYHYKIRKIFNNVNSYFSVKEVNVIHAHTLFSDGGVAFRLNKEFNIPYLVTVRGSDVWAFFKYMVHLRSYGLKILLNASVIVFISPSYLDKLFSYSIFNEYRDLLIKKSIVIPNGVDKFWIENVKEKKYEIQSPLKLLFVGRIIKSKNLVNLSKAVIQLNSIGFSCVLDVYGDPGSGFKPFMKFVDKFDFIKYNGFINSKEELVNVYRSHSIFVMPSYNETFGLVYIEALSQGIPVLYSLNDGIDNFYRDIGKAVDPTDINSIAEGIKSIYENYSSLLFDPKIIVNNHNWDLISKKYYDLYLKAI